MAEKKSEANPKPTRSRKKAEPPPEVVEESPAQDRRFLWAMAVVALLVAFVGGYAIGHAVDRGGSTVGADVIDGRRGDDGGFPGADRGDDRRQERGERPDGRQGQRIPGPDSRRPGDRIDLDEVCDSMPVIEDGQAFLGIVGQTTDDGVLVVRVIPIGAAGCAGIEPGDQITSFDGTAVDSIEQLGDLVAAHDPGDAVVVGISGADGAREVTVTLGSRPVPPQG